MECESILLAAALNPSPTSAKGSLRSPGLRILSHRGRGRGATLADFAWGIEAARESTSPLVGEDSKPVRGIADHMGALGEG
jgi:hypothetical protein